jgi:hypothetical protein
MLANDSPYEIANVVLRKMGLYALYLASSNTWNRSKRMRKR